jgi:hypothetical protein
VNIVHMKVTWNVLAACESFWLSRKAGTAVPAGANVPLGIRQENLLPP